MLSNNPKQPNTTRPPETYEFCIFSIKKKMTSPLKKKINLRNGPDPII